MNKVVLVGNITGDIHYDESNSFMRVILMAGRPRIITGLRILFVGQDAEKFHPYLRRGAEIGIVGYLKTRHFRGKLVTEIVVNHLVLLRNTNLDKLVGHHGNASSGKSSFIIGSVKSDVRLKWRKKISNDSYYAFLGLTICNEEYPDGLDVIINGALAELVHPYLQAGSVVAVDGHIRSNDKTQMVTQHLALLQNINWAAQMESPAEQTIQPDEFI